MALTDEQITQERKFLEGIPRFNIAAFFLPPIWGPAHGLWITILFYPIWLFADNTFYAAWEQRTVISLVVAALAFIILVGLTVGFAIVAQPYAAHRAVNRGVDKETYVKRQRIWAVVCVIIGIVMLALATYYNLVIRPTMGVVE